MTKQSVIVKARNVLSPRNHHNGMRVPSPNVPYKKRTDLTYSAKCPFWPGANVNEFPLTSQFGSKQTFITPP